MEQFEGLKALYSQLFNLDEEIHKLISKGFIEEAVQKTQLFERISKEVGLAKKTIKYTEEQKQEVEKLDAKLKDVMTNFMSELAQLKVHIKQKLDQNKETLKVNSAYSVETPEHGQLFDSIE